ncbi:MAG: hypothetical protein A4E23_00125 [Methanomethylovorans sp. PtaU1.Bin073]|nr:MAG: hypothetical protein A4E23_00125 [Methanomethylovorans sp. PtaU1.Bin073]
MNVKILYIFAVCIFSSGIASASTNLGGILLHFNESDIIEEHGDIFTARLDPAVAEEKLGINNSTVLSELGWDINQSNESVKIKSIDYFIRCKRIDIPSPEQVISPPEQRNATTVGDGTDLGPQNLLTNKIPEGGGGGGGVVTGIAIGAAGNAIYEGGKAALKVCTKVVVETAKNVWNSISNSWETTTETTTQTAGPCGDDGGPGGGNSGTNSGGAPPGGM